MIKVNYPSGWSPGPLSEVARMTLQTGINQGHNWRTVMSLAKDVARAARATGLTANGLGESTSAQAIATAIQILDNGGVYRYLIELRQNIPAYREKDRQFLYILLRQMANDT